MILFFLPICASFNTFLCKSLISALSSILDLEVGRSTHDQLCPNLSRPCRSACPLTGDILCDKCGQDTQDTLLSCYPCCTAENKVTQVNWTLNTRVLIEAYQFLLWEHVRREFVLWLQKKDCLYEFNRHVKRCHQLVKRRKQNLLPNILVFISNVICC